VLVDAMQMTVHAAQQHPAARIRDLAQAVKRVSMQEEIHSTKFKKGELK
jgi:hypothetical protein